MRWQHLVSQARGRIGKLGNLFFTLLGDEHSIDNNTNEFANILCNIFKKAKYWWGQLCLSQTLVVTSPYGPYANLRPCSWHPLCWPTNAKYTNVWWEIWWHFKWLTYDDTEWCSVMMSVPKIHVMKLRVMILRLSIEIDNWRIKKDDLWFQLWLWLWL